MEKKQKAKNKGKKSAEQKQAEMLADEEITCGVRGLMSDEENGIEWVGCNSLPPCFFGSGLFHYNCNKNKLMSTSVLSHTIFTDSVGNVFPSSMWKSKHGLGR